MAMLPVGVEELTRAGHQVLIEAGAGIGSGIPDTRVCCTRGPRSLRPPKEIFGRADMIVKVKEPLREEIALIRKGQIVFTYFHFAADRELTEAMLNPGATCLAYETLARRPGPAAAADADERSRGADEHSGRGQVSGAAAAWAAGFCWPACRAWRRRTSRSSAAASSGRMRPRSPPAFGPTSRSSTSTWIGCATSTTSCRRTSMCLFSDRHTIREQLRLADLVIGAVLIPGAKAPRLITREDLKLMKPGSVIIDVAIDQGGCVETSRPTTHSDPTYLEEDVLHYCVTNMPGAVGRTSTFALCNVTLPLVLQLAKLGIDQAIQKSPPLASAANIHRGRITNQAVAETFGLNYEPTRSAVGNALRGVPRARRNRDRFLAAERR